MFGLAASLCSLTADLSGLIIFSCDLRGIFVVRTEDFRGYDIWSLASAPGSLKFHAYCLRFELVINFFVWPLKIFVVKTESLRKCDVLVSLRLPVALIACLSSMLRVGNYILVAFENI